MKLYVLLVAPILMTIFITAVSADDNKSKAKETFREGVSLFHEKDFEGAATAFRRANALNPTWALQYNIGQSEAAAKRYGLAYEAFEAYVSLGGDELSEERRDEVVKELDRLLKLIGAVAVVAPKGAAVFIDGVMRGIVPLPGRLKVAVGVVHEVAIRKDGQTLHTEQVKVSRGETVKVTASEAEEVPSADEGATPTDDGPAPSNADEQIAADDDVDQAAADDNVDQTAAPAEPSRPTKETIGIISLASGGALLVGAAVTGSIALSKNKKLKSDCPDDVCPTDRKNDALSRDLLALGTDILLGVGIAAAAVGVGLIVWSKKERRTTESETTAVTISPILGRQTAGVGVTGRF